MEYLPSTDEKEGYITDIINRKNHLLSVITSYSIHYTKLYDESPKLRMISREQNTFDERLHQLLDDMRETLEHANGAGLAAVQVGILRRIAIVDVGEGVIELINPVILSAEGEQEVTEGCLSVVGKWGRTVITSYSIHYTKLYDYWYCRHRPCGACHDEIPRSGH